MLKVSPGLWQWEYINFKILISAVVGSMVVMTQKPWFDSLEKPNLFSPIVTKLACRENGGGG